MRQQKCLWLLAVFSVTLFVSLIGVEGGRTISFTNNCPYTVWIGSTGGAGPTCGGGCPSGFACNPNNNICFWVLPTPDSGTTQLNPGQSSNVYLNNGPDGNVQWSGNVWGKTGCGGNGQGCQSGDCGTCIAGTGATGPTTLAEFTFQANGADYYDVSLINGVNVPIEMGPSGTGSGSAYSCGNPGGANANNGALQGCSWNFNPTINGQNLENYLAYVYSTSNQGCSSNNDCGGGEVCGLNLQKNQVCGNQIGWYTADEVCGGDNFGNPFNCGNGVPGQGTQSDLYGCEGENSNSCYQPGANNVCCGCPNWNVNGQNIPTGPGFSCQNYNSAWSQYAEPFALFLKQACPTGYSFPYDDATSTFTCGSNNNQNYYITYCPN
eukprot:TRINITY_DN13410_c0_g1_i1.p1 TRINITY_DN13410_c0_g1~~TRINITY_DN13410_c0_g1_i1.p1  ORF type:complete len:379 (+),score=24.04 TRINITY_DN13410_c0_g1_i1:31-1167(+)